MDRTDITRLVELAAAGDADAYAEIVRRYRDHVYGYCYHFTGSFEDAGDLAQDTFVRAYTRIGQLREPEKIGAWLRKIAGNLCARWIESRRETPVERVELGQTPRESSQAIAVREALSSLPENERLAVVLKYVNGYSYDDIAGFLEVSPAAVRGRLHRGRKLLKAEVLKMTRDTFDENRLDEKFVIEAVYTAVREAHNAYDMLKDKELSRRKTEKAVSLIDQIELDKAKDPVALGNAMLFVATRELVLGEKNNAEERWNRAESLFRKAGDQDGVQRCRDMVAYQRMTAGDLGEAHRMFSEAAHYWWQRGSEASDVGIRVEKVMYKAAALGLESIGLDTDRRLIVSFLAGSCPIGVEDDQFMCGGASFLGFHDEGYPSRVMDSGPPFGPTPLPFVLMRTKPEVGDTLRFVNGWDKRSEESVLESLSETVKTPAGTFSNCAHSTSRVFATEDWTGDVIATRGLWIAPGVGIVRISYQKTGHPSDTSELVSYHVETPSDDYIPLAVGNWWKWRWSESEEEFGFRTEECKEIVAREENRWVCAAYVYAARR